MVVPDSSHQPNYYLTQETKATVSEPKAKLSRTKNFQNVIKATKIIIKVIITIIIITIIKPKTIYCLFTPNFPI
jgi:hypothetical protein